MPLNVTRYLTDNSVNDSAEPTISLEYVLKYLLGCGFRILKLAPCYNVESNSIPFLVVYIGKSVMSVMEMLRSSYDT